MFDQSVLLRADTKGSSRPFLLPGVVGAGVVSVLLAHSHLPWDTQQSNPAACGPFPLYLCHPLHHHPSAIAGIWQKLEPSISEWVWVSTCKRTSVIFSHFPNLPWWIQAMLFIYSRCDNQTVSYVSAFSLIFPGANNKRLVIDSGCQAKGNAYFKHEKQELYSLKG